MVEYIVAILTKKCVSIDDSNDKFEIYVYGMKYILCSLVAVIGVCIYGLLNGMFVWVVLFTVSFCLIRQCIGGFHAPNNVSCFLIFMFGTVLFSELVRYCPKVKENSIVGSILMGIYLLLVIKFAPFETKGNTILPDIRKSLKRKGIIRELLLFCMYVLLYGYVQSAALAILCGVSWSMMLFLVGIIQKTWR